MIMFQDPEVRVAREVPVVRMVPQQRRQVNQEDLGVLEGQEGRVDPQPSLPESQVDQENLVVPVAPADPVVRAAQEVLGDQEVQMVLKQQHQDQVYQQVNQQQENREPQGSQEALTAPVDPAVQEDRVGHVSTSNVV